MARTPCGLCDLLSFTLIRPPCLSLSCSIPPSLHLLRCLSQSVKHGSLSLILCTSEDQVDLHDLFMRVRAHTSSHDSFFRIKMWRCMPLHNCHGCPQTVALSQRSRTFSSDSRFRWELGQGSCAGHNETTSRERTRCVSRGVVALNFRRVRSNIGMSLYMSSLPEHNGTRIDVKTNSRWPVYQILV